MMLDGEFDVLVVTCLLDDNCVGDKKATKQLCNLFGVHGADTGFLDSASSNDVVHRQSSSPHARAQHTLTSMRRH
jgi:hypothetical protein